MGPANAGVLDRATERRSRFRVIEGLYDPAPSWQRRQALHRRFLGMGDVLASALAIAIVLALPGGAQLGPVVLAGMPLTVLIFKIAGLYDHDQLRIAHSTLDELPMLAQLTGLYALSVTILQSFLIEGGLGGAQIAGLWFATFAAIMAGRMAARWLAGRLTLVERCLVIGELRARRAHPREARAATPARTSSPRCRSRRTTSTPDRPGRRPAHRARPRGRPHHHRSDAADTGGVVELDPDRARRRASGSASCRACSRSSARRSSSTTSTA